MAQHVAQTEESAVVMRDEVEAVQPERIGELADAFDLGVVGGRGIGRIGAAEPGPVSGDDAVPVGQRGDLVPPAGCALRIAVQEQNRLTLAGVRGVHIHIVQNSIKFAA